MARKSPKILTSWASHSVRTERIFSTSRKVSGGVGLAMLVEPRWVQPSYQNGAEFFGELLQNERVRRAHKALEFGRGQRIFRFEGDPLIAREVGRLDDAGTLD